MAPIYKPVYAVYDEIAGVYGAPLVFENGEIAYVTVRRNIRDLYFHEEVTLDALRDSRLVHIGFYDDGNGSFRNIEDENEIETHAYSFDELVKEKDGSYMKTFSEVQND